MSPRPDCSISSSAAEGGGHGRVYAGKSAAERDAARRRRLLIATFDIVGTHGYAQLTVERLCTQANVSTRDFYKLYDSKESAFADLYDYLLVQSNRRIRASLAESAGRPLSDRIPAAIVAYLAPMFADLRTARIVFVEVVGLSARIEETRLRNRERLIRLVEAEGRAAAARGDVTDRDFRFAATALVGSAAVLAHDWMIRDVRPPIEQLEQQLAALAVTLLTKPSRDG
jgi:AcrR family transcriptional regulator